MKITEVQEYKQVNSTVVIDLASMKSSIFKLDEMLKDEAFDGDEVTECCERIEELAQAISSGVISRHRLVALLPIQVEQKLLT